jgi:hypothetical protein
MLGMLATGGPRLGPLHGRIDFMPLVTILLVLLVVRAVLKVALTWPVVVSAVFAGTVLSGAIQVWGVLYPSAAAFGIAAILTAPLHRRGGRHAPEV